MRQDHRSRGRRSATIGILIALACVLAAPTAAPAQDFPTRTVKIVVPFPPAGGTLDTLARIVAEEFQSVYRQPAIDLEPLGTTPDGMRDLIKRSEARWAPVIKAAKQAFDARALEPISVTEHLMHAAQIRMAHIPAKRVAEDHMLTLYHGKTSVCSIKARLALAEKGVDWDGRLLTLRGDQFEPAYMKLNPNAVVPTLVHDGKVIIESTVVMHYVDEAFPGPSLVPADPPARAALRMTTKLMDEYVHNSCTTLTFATANRAQFTRMSPEQFEAELAKSPDPKRSEIKRQVVKHGLEAPLVVDALRHHETLLDRIEAAMQDGPFIAGSGYSLADAAATPYVWRLDKLKLARMWDDRPGVAAWYERIRARPSFKTAVEDWMTAADHERYANEPDPWPKVREILRAG